MTPQELENIFPSLVRNESKLRIWLNNGTYYLYAWYNKSRCFYTRSQKRKSPHMTLFYGIVPKSMTCLKRLCE